MRCHQQLRGQALVVDCGGCAGAGSLGDAHCLQAFFTAVPAHASFQHVVLRRLVEVRYQAGATSLLKGAADLVREFEDLHPSRSRRCARCPSRPAAAAQRAVLARWGYPSPLPLAPRGKKCANCVASSQKIAAEVEDRLHAIESKALAETLIAKEC
ncbi:MAG: hypothetical protein ACOYOE_14965 [Chlorobium sp.]